MSETKTHFSADELAEMVERATSWAFDSSTGSVVGRDKAINEELMALDVLDLVAHIVNPMTFHIRCLYCGHVGSGVDWQGAEDGAREHMQVCESHPVRELERKLAEVTAAKQAEMLDGLANYSQVCEQLAEMTKARDEACDLLMRHFSDNDVLVEQVAGWRTAGKDGAR